MKIALLGCHINSTNLGCQALTYSLVQMLESISKAKNTQFEYVLFEYAPSEETTQEFCNRVHVDQSRIMAYRIAPVYRWRSYIKHFRRNTDMLRRIKECDVAIDLTAGDSFSDIYGRQRFISLTRIKRMVELLGVPLILGPQTYGPFQHSGNYRTARRVMENAKAIIARDAVSAKLASEMVRHQVETTTDLAFQLPYRKNTLEHDRSNIGINISGLLVRDHIEKGIEDTVRLSVDYDQYILSLVKSLCNDGYHIYLVPHVDEDYKASKDIHDLFPETELVAPFTNPIDAKSFISALDCFIGARMHATIAAFSSGVAVIPTAYSRKFDDLFSTIGYNRTIDLRTETTDSAVEKTLKYVKERDLISAEISALFPRLDDYTKLTESFFIHAMGL